MVVHPDGGYDLIAVCVCTHQVDSVLETLVDVKGDVLFLCNWAAGPGPLGAVIGAERVLLGFPSSGGTLDGEVVRYPATSFLTRRVAMPIGEPDGRLTPRLEQVVGVLRAAVIKAKAHSQMDAWLKTHAAFEVPLGLAVHSAGGPGALADDPDAVRNVVGSIRRNLAALPMRPVPRGFVALQALPVGLVVPALRRFLRSPAATRSALSSTAPSVRAELERLTGQLRANAAVQ